VVCYDRLRSQKIDPRIDNGFSITTDDRKMALDARLIAQAEDDPASKINALVETVTATWRCTDASRDTQLIFYDMGVNRTPWGYSVYNGDGPALGRELELASVLGFIQSKGISNVVWLTADVHYSAAHYYDPARAQFTDFTPFWEFVAGPLHAGTFGPNRLDNTFGPEVKFLSIPEGLEPNRPPSDGLQFFGLVKIDGQSEVMTVSLHNLLGGRLYSVELSPEP
jgi:alkaline phosphatase D